MARLALLPLALASLYHAAATDECSTVQVSRGLRSGLKERTHVSSLSFSKLGAATSSSPEFRNLLQEIDKKMAPISEPTLEDDRCMDMVRQLSSSKGRVEKKVEVHTGAFLASGSFEDLPDVFRKLRLAPMSFLATQDLENVKLRFWSNLSPDHHIVQEIFRPILEGTRYADSIEISQFNPTNECAIAFPSSREEGRALCKVYESQTDQTSLSDLMRVTVLHNYGGAWIDSDVLLIRDLRPILEEDWAYLGQQDWVNNAVMSTSGPRSPFMKAYLSYVVGKRIVTWHCEYGPVALLDLAREVERQEATGTFHILPTCFFDGGWSGVEGAPDWDDFFTSRSSEDQEAYIAPRLSHNAFAFHWHGRWESPIRQGSLAEFAEQLYTDFLQLPDREKLRN